MWPVYITHTILLKVKPLGQALLLALAETESSLTAGAETPTIQTLHHPHHGLSSYALETQDLQT